MRQPLQRLSWLAPLLTRLTLAEVFVESGWGKLHGLPKVVAFFTDLGVPVPAFTAPLTAVTEFGCGMLLLVGLLTRLAALPLIVTMIVAILTAKKGDLHGFSDLTGFIEYLYIVLLVWLVIEGAGVVSVDSWLRRKPRELRKAA